MVPGTSHFDWTSDDWLRSIRSEQVTQTFEADDHGRLARHVLHVGDAGPRVFEYVTAAVDGHEFEFTPISRCSAE